MTAPVEGVNNSLERKKDGLGQPGGKMRKGAAGGGDQKEALGGVIRKGRQMGNWGTGGR